MWLSEEEQMILRFLEQIQGGATAREICRKAATKDKWKENERWAIPFLQRLREKGLIDTDAGGTYRVPRKEK